MNVYQRLQKARVELQKQPLKESGKNTFANYSYLELGDFLPQINAICSEVGLCGMVSFSKDEATLTMVNSDKAEEIIVFAAPMSTAELKGCHQVQNLGAVMSYMRRYLWLAAFEIVEHDALDATTGKKEQQAPKQQTRSTPQDSDCITEAQQKMIFAKMKSAGVEPERLKEAFKVESSKQLKKSQVNDVVAWIEGEAQGTGY